MNILFVKLIDNSLEYPKSYWKKNWINLKIKLKYPIFQTILEEKILFLPNKKFNIRKLENIIKKFKKKYNIEQIILAEDLPVYIKDEIRKKEQIISSKELMPYIVDELLKFICIKQQEEISSKDIIILVKETSQINLYWIEYLATHTKSITIVTTQINKFLTLEKKLTQENGIAMLVSNNKRKSLTKAKIIINLDFEEELLNQYQININAIIINITHQIKKLPKEFQGININQAEITLPQQSIQEYKQKKLYKIFPNSILYLKKIKVNKFIEACKKIKEDNIEVSNIIGINGIIQTEELIKKS